MDKKLGEVIAFHRRKMKLSQIDVATRLADYDINVKNAAVSAWEKGYTTPTADTLLALCQILEISDIYAEFIGNNPYNPLNDLNEEGVQKALDYIELLKKSGDYEKKEAEIFTLPPRIMKVALVPASAGDGNYLDEENFDEVEFYEPVPEKADFGVYLGGDSMEPRFTDGELVWIEKTEYLESGDIGLFFLEGMTYFKKFVQTEAGTFLVSLNPKYQPLQVQESHTFKILGKLAEFPPE